MSKAIRGLSKWRPTEEGWDDLFDEIQNQTDRGAGIIAGSFLDATLQLALNSYFAQGASAKLLEDFGAPLASFSSRIIAGAALGLYTAEIQAELDTIRHVRNAFAHTLKPLDFGEQAISEACMTLPNFAFDENGPHFPDTWSEARRRYVGTCFGRGHNLVGLALKYGGREIPVEITD